MSELPKYLPIGSPVSVQHMPEEYYERHSALILAERRAHREAVRAGNDHRLWAVSYRAAKRLTEHENGHDTR